MSRSDALIAFTPQRAADVAGLTRRQVDYWRKTLLLEPSTDEAVSAHRSVRLYDFNDMLALMTIGELLRRKVPTRRVRKVVEKAREYGYARPLTEIKYGVADLEGKRKRVMVVLTLADGSTVGDDDMGQAIMPETIDVEAIRAKLRGSVKRRKEQHGRTERRRGALASKEVFAGTRVPVATVRTYVAEDVPDDEILEAFPALTKADLSLVRRAG